MLTIDGKDGGGQVLRSSLGLSIVTGQPFRITNIRGKRPKPGLMRQHLTCVKAAAEISSAAVDGAELHSPELLFYPGQVRAGDYRFAIGTAGSTTLLLQTLLPALWTAESESRLTLEGGTHNPFAPPFEFVDRVYFRAIHEMGVNVVASLRRPGFFPAGGGVIEATVQPADKLASVDWLEHGEAVADRIRVLSCNLPTKIATRIGKSAAQALQWDLEPVIEERDDSTSPGICCFVERECINITEVRSILARQGVPAERLGNQVAKAMKAYIGSRAVVGCHLADQLLVPIALAGKGTFLTLSPDDHVATNIRVIEAFLPCRFTIEEEEDGRIRISCRTPS